MDAQRIWNTAKKEFRQVVTLRTYQQVVMPAHAVALRGGALVVAVDSEAACAFLKRLGAQVGRIAESVGVGAIEFVV